MSQKKVVDRNIAIVLAILCVVSLMGAVGAVIYFNGFSNGSNNDSAYAALQASNSAYVNDHSHTNADYENLKSQLQSLQQ